MRTVCKRLLKPDIVLPELIALSPGLLKQYGLAAVILDVDNTMAEPDSGESYAGVTEWIGEMRNNGIALVILSNNKPSRVAPYAQSVGISFVCDTKPLARGYKKAAAEIGRELSECCAVGDQLFTDVLGARLSGCFSCLTIPKSPDQTAFIRLKRFLERPFLKALSLKEILKG